jgi:hypothetical protein
MCSRYRTQLRRHPIPIQQSLLLGCFGTITSRVLVRVLINYLLLLLSPSPPNSLTTPPATTDSHPSSTNTTTVRLPPSTWPCRLTHLPFHRLPSFPSRHSPLPIYPSPSPSLNSPLSNKFFHQWETGNLPNSNDSGSVVEEFGTVRKLS